MKFLHNLFVQSSQPVSFKEIVYWWGGRRLAFNLMIGLTGLLSILICCLAGFPLDWTYVVIYAGTYCIAANVLYTGGWIAEYFIRKGNNWDPRINYIGPVFFAMGLILMILVTFFGGLFAGYIGLFDPIEV